MLAFGNLYIWGNSIFMRIVHFSDIHLSKQNYNEFVDNFKDALIKDLKDYNNNDKSIDLIIITGDLVDRGGYSLFEIDEFKSGYDNPYKIFEKIFINPIADALSFNKHHIIFIPGNHDVDERVYSYYDECEMVRNINKTTITDFLNHNESSFTYNERIRKFKEFEKEYHLNNLTYKPTNNQSVYVHDYLGKKIGFLLINDSWRCKTVALKIDDDKLFFGSQQINNALRTLKEFQTDINISLFHHSIEDYKESDEVQRLLVNKEIDLYLYGHYHSQKFEKLITPINNCFGIRGRALLNRPNETVLLYQPGYQILDLDIDFFKIEKIIFRRYSYDNISFVSDVDTAPPIGEYKGKLNNGLDFEDRSKGKLNLDIQNFKSL
jgi:DNA repair exonuclease SbcCD nuclease subunit